jgi:hypothetical protein
MTTEKGEMDIHEMTRAAEQLSTKPPRRKRRGKKVQGVEADAVVVDEAAEVPAEAMPDRDALSERKGYATAPECVNTVSLAGIEATVIGGTHRPRGGWRLKLTGEVSDEQVDGYLGNSTVFVYLPDGDDVMPNRKWVDRAIALGVPVVVPAGTLPKAKADCGVEIRHENLDLTNSDGRARVGVYVKQAIAQVEKGYDAYVQACLGTK